MSDELLFADLKVIDMSKLDCHTSGRHHFGGLWRAGD